MGNPVMIGSGGRPARETPAWRPLNGDDVFTRDGTFYIIAEPTWPGKVSAADAMRRVAWILANKEWSVSMLEDIGEIVTAAGFAQDPHDDYVSH